MKIFPENFCIGAVAPAGPVSDETLSGGVAALQKLGVKVKLMPHVQSGSSMHHFLSILHVDHNLRKESKEEYRFVRNLAKRLGIPFKGIHAKVEKKRGESLEMAARRVRLDFFSQCMDKLGLDAIATGHHMDDVAETFLMKIKRASLCGIRETSVVGNIRFVRPLLGCRDRELKAYLEKFGETWREDASNDDVTIERNKVRHEVIPYLEKMLDRKLVEHLFKISSFLNS